MIIITLLYITIGFFGYLKYGDNVKGGITLNLDVTEPLAQTAILMMSLAILFSYTLQIYVPLEMILPALESRVPAKWHLLTEFALRYGLVLFTFAMAAAIPKLDLFISLVGSVSSSTLALMAPSILHTVTYWNELREKPSGKFIILRNLFLFCLGFVGFIAGGFTSLSNIIAYF